MLIYIYSNLQFVLDSTVDNVVISFLRLFIYLMCAIEEVDWNIFLANHPNNDVVIDQSCWNIYDPF